MVTRGRGILLEGVVVFLVHNDEPQVPMRQEQGRPGAQDQVLRSFQHGFGYGCPPGPGFGAVIHQRVWEYCGHPVLQLPGKGNFRDQEEDTLSLCQGFAGQLQVKFRFSGAGDAVQQHRFAGAKCCAHCSCGLLLLPGELYFPARFRCRLGQFRSHTVP